MEKALGFTSIQSMRFLSLILFLASSVSCIKDDSPDIYAGLYENFDSWSRVWQLILHPDGRALHLKHSVPTQEKAYEVMKGEWSYDNGFVVFKFRDQKIRFSPVEFNLSRENGIGYAYNKGASRLSQLESYFQKYNHN